MKDPGNFGDNGEDLDRKLPPREDFSSSTEPVGNANAAVVEPKIKGPPVASLNSTTQNRSNKENADFELAFEIQTKENLAGLAQQRRLQEAANNSALFTGPLRMGAAPYESTVRVRDRIGNPNFSRARQQAVVELPEFLLPRPGGVTMVSNNSTSLTTPETSVTQGSSDKIIRRHLKAPHIWYDVSRPGDGDPVVLQLLGGNYDCVLNFIIDWRFGTGKIPTLSDLSPTLFGELVVEAKIRILPSATPPAGEDKIDDRPQGTMENVLFRLANLQISFREAALWLPFSLRFQLERCMLMDVDSGPSYIPIRKRHAPKKIENQEKAILGLQTQARKMLMVFLQDVMPPLLRSVERLGNSLTLQELFADELWEPLREVKKKIHEGKKISFASKVDEALTRALDIRAGAEQLCNCKEEDLQLSEGMSSEEYIDIIRKRSLWPTGEYRARFSQDGRFLAKGLEIVNKFHARKALESEGAWTFERAFKDSTPVTRRGIRELGWDFRDRFLVFSDVPFHDVFQNNLAVWCRDNATVCGRRYEFLFDKGASKPSLWFFAPSTLCSREQFLNKVGSLEGVEKSKLGDRIGLAFSVTKPLLQLELEQIVAIPEIIRNGYRFTDGCGVMGINVAKKVKEAFGGPFPGSIQIRLGGVKGMLTVKKDFDPDSIGIRPSMVKFPSNSRVLEVKSCAIAKTGSSRSLFFPALLIMHHQGVPTEAFMDLQRRAWAEIALKWDKDAAGLLNEPVDFSEVSRYMQGVVKGRKANKEQFTQEELTGIIHKMEEGKKSDVKVNLHCNVTLMQGVVDEHNILEEGEVLVGNGRIVGDVLILRPPCASVGDIQRVKAVPRRHEPHFKLLNDSLVFSVRGERPLADMLGGGDYDGDEFYVVNERLLLESFKAAEPSDFGTQREHITDTISVMDCFCVAEPKPPVLSHQLEVLQHFMKTGDIVSSSAEAWARLADVYGPTHRRTLMVTKVCQRALDARKTGCVFEELELAEIDKVLSEHHPERIEKPRWRGGPDTNPATSILGALFDKWEDKISAIRATRDHVQKYGLSDDTSVCEGTVVSEITQDTRALDKKAALPALGSGKTGTEILIDVLFGQKDFRFRNVTPVDFANIDEKSRLSLISMVLQEFESAVDSDKKKAEQKYYAPNDYPREYDIFLIRQEWGFERLAVALPVPRTEKDIEFRVDDGILQIDEVEYRRRVSSLSGFARIIDALMVNPVPQLMLQAMSRSGLVDAVSPDSVSMDSSLMLRLNRPQLLAVATVLSPSFKSGFFAIQGPPGTGKTTTIVEMICSKKRALVLAPSNAAVSNIALRLIERPEYSLQNVVIWGDNNIDDSVSFLNPKRRYLEFNSFLRRDSNENDAAAREQNLRKLADWLGHPELSFEQVEALCNDVDGHASIAAARVVLCTLNTAGSRSLRKAVQSSKKFELCVLDEASQCTEAEFYVATTFPGVKRMVVVGDPQQLGPTVVNEACEALGYGESWLGQILRYHPAKVHLLAIQYRMQPSPLLDWVNRTFYKNRLISAESVKNMQPEIKKPFLFVSTSEQGFGAEAREGTSYKNLYEVGVIKDILCKDPDIRAVLEGTDNPRVIIITPYKAQVEILRKTLANTKRLRNLDMKTATVDSFQGQEGDIVIVSTVRTDSIGFSDHPQRICVSLTRHKRVIRLIGDLKFFMSLENKSALKQLAVFAHDNRLVEDSTTGPDAWRRPKWNPGDFSWKPTMTSRFYDCVQKMSQRESNIAFNVLHAVCVPEINKLRSRPAESDLGRWQISALTSDDEINVVWLAKRLEDPQYVGVIEGHYAGRKNECNTFTQKHRVLPSHNACGVEKNLSGCKGTPTTELALVHSTEVDIQRWTVTSDLQNAAMNDADWKLPEGLFSLDNQQQRILTMDPPLLLESRSGTGKTNVLFQHCLSRAKQDADLLAPSLFVTVSKKLQEELKRRYESVKRISQTFLPPIAFFHLRELLQYLLDNNAIQKNTLNATTYLHFVHHRKSYQKQEVEPTLVQNELGGVIYGSLSAAQKQRPLHEDEYLEEIRSNVSNKDDTGRSKRKLIYGEFVSYRRWKEENQLYDLHEIVLDLIALGDRLRCKHFVSAYLDEVQDFNYATIFLICSIAGTMNAHWVAAGDTAQMISPGCSFRFAGLQSVLRAVKPSVMLSKVEKLKRNYRMTKSVLDLGNSILNVLKKNFPNQIEFASPETPMKDLGLKVYLVRWREAEKISASLDMKQAVIYSGSSVDEESQLNQQLSDWTSNHPLMMSVLDAKGLEYDDILVVFNKVRGAWNPSNKTTESLRNLRELYVACTRAKKRVVIIAFKKEVVEFFQSLEAGVEVTSADIALLDFNRETTAADWFQEGKKYFFTDENFQLAENCFIRAGDFGWSNWSQGKRLQRVGRVQEAKLAYRTSSRAFYEVSVYDHCLDVLRDMAEMKLKWEDIDNEVLENALEECPNHLPRDWVVRFALFRDSWDSISAQDLQNRTLAPDFREHRNDPRLKALVRSCDESERKRVQIALPSVIGDYCWDERKYTDAAVLFAAADDFGLAVKATEKAIEEVKKQFSETDILRLVDAWNKYELARKSAVSDAQVSQLLTLFRDPARASKKGSATQLLKRFGHSIVRLAVVSNGKDPTILHAFDNVAFRDDVDQELIRKFAEAPIKIVDWYHTHQDRTNATRFASANLKTWSSNELVYDILGTYGLRPEGIEAEIQRHGALLNAVQVVLGRQDFAMAETLSNMALQSTPEAATELVERWDTVLNNNQVKQSMEQNALNSDIFLLLKMFQDPRGTGTKLGRKCFATFGKELVHRAVQGKAPYGKLSNYDVLKSYDGTAFESEKPKPKPKPAPVAPRAVQLQSGDRVLVSGLKNQRYNGKRGTVTDVLNGGRYAVTVDGDDNGKTISVKGDNLSKLQQEPASPAGGKTDGKSKGASKQASKIDPPASSAGTDSKAAPKTKQNNRKAPGKSNENSDSDDSEVPGLAERPMADSSDEDNNDNYRKPDSVASSSDSSDESVPPLVGSKYDKKTSEAYDSSDSEEPPGLIDRERHNSSSESSSDHNERASSRRPTQQASSDEESSESDVPPPMASGRPGDGGFYDSSDSEGDGAPPALADRHINAGELSSGSDDSSVEGMPGYLGGRRPAAAPPATFPNPPSVAAGQPGSQPGQGGRGNKKGKRGGRGRGKK